MNVFIIPSWYPSEDHPTSGIFIKEQAVALAENYPEYNFGISNWGQKEEDKLIWAREPLRSIRKLFNHRKKKSITTTIRPNLFEFYNPSLTWTRKFLSGNISAIINSNKKNYKEFSALVGKIDLIHAHTAYPGGYVANGLSKLYKIPFVITEHMTPFPFKCYLTRGSTIDNCVLEPIKEASAVIAVSPDLNYKMVELGITTSVFIPNLVNENFFKPQRDKNEPQEFSFFTLGRMVEQKGIPVLLKAISKVNRNVSFRIGGEGESLGDYQKSALLLGLDNVVWLGRLNREEVKKELQKCQAFVLPSLHENFPLVLLEAIACGKPIITTNCGGPESIVTGKNGLLAKVGDSDDLAKKLRWMIKNYSNYNSFVIRQDFLRRFSQRVLCPKLLDLYNDVIK